MIQPGIEAAIPSPESVQHYIRHFDLKIGYHRYRQTGKSFIFGKRHIHYNIIALRSDEYIRGKKNRHIICVAARQENLRVF